jgi:RNA polymerase sigma-70 factor (ECF subfamily)
MQRRAIAILKPVESVPPVPSVPKSMDAADSRARVRSMFDAYHNLVWRTLRRYGLDAEAAADVSQQAFVVAIERIADIWPGSERAFLIGTALRLSRSARRNMTRYSLDGQLEERLKQPARHPEAEAMTLELLDLVLAQLDRDLVEVFVLFDIEGFSAPELARALAIPVGTVASRVRRAREAFRATAKRLEHVFEREQGR